MKKGTKVRINPKEGRENAKVMGNAMVSFGEVK